MEEKLLINGVEPIFHVVMDKNKFELTEEDAMWQDMADEYAVVVKSEANAGLIVYGKFNGEWKANPWSVRFLIRVLLENSGICLSSFNKKFNPRL